jgi:phage terminase large subunit-like protein
MRPANRLICSLIRYQSLSEPSKKILAAVARGKLHHGAHPVLRWIASCLATIERNDNLMFAKPEREKSTSRIDGMSALANAMARAMMAPEEEQWAKTEVW